MEVGTLLLIGDHAFDIEAGARAGALTMFLENGLGTGRAVRARGSDFVVRSLFEARRVIGSALPSPPA